MFKIQWTSRMTNVEVLSIVNKERELLTSMKRKTTYLEHLIWNEKYNYLQFFIEGKKEARSGIGRKRLSWLRNIRQWTGVNSYRKE